MTTLEFAKRGLLVMTFIAATLGVVGTVHAFIMTGVIKPAVKAMIQEERDARVQSQAQLQQQFQSATQVSIRDRGLILLVLDARSASDRQEKLELLKRQWLLSSSSGGN